MGKCEANENQKNCRTAVSVKHKMGFMAKT